MKGVPLREGVDIRRKLLSLEYFFDVGPIIVEIVNNSYRIYKESNAILF